MLDGQMLVTIQILAVARKDRKALGKSLCHHLADKCLPLAVTVSRRPCGSCRNIVPFEPTLSPADTAARSRNQPAARWTGWRSAQADGRLIRYASLADPVPDGRRVATYRSNRDRCRQLSAGGDLWSAGDARLRVRLDHR